MRSIKNIGIKVTNNDGPEIIKMLVDCGANNRWNFDGKSYPSEAIYFQSTEHDAIGCQLTKKECKEKFGVIRVFNSLSEFVAWWCKPEKTKLTIKPEFETKLREIGVYSRWLKNYNNSPVKCKASSCKCRLPEEERLLQLNKSLSFTHFIIDSFDPESTSEGLQFWIDVACNKTHPWEM